MRRLDAAVAAGLLVVALVGIAFDDGHLAGLEVAMTVLMILPLAWVDRRPVAAVVAAGVALSVLRFADVQPSTGAALAVVYLLFVLGDRMGARAAFTTAVAFAAVALAEGLVTGSSDAVFVVVVLMAPAFVLGRLARSRREQQARLEQLRAELERERGRAAVLAAEAERGRIARELHDALSHGVSLMVLQAAAAAQLAVSDPEGARAALAVVRRTGEGARDELAQMAATAPDAAPAAALDAIVAGVRAAGVAVSVEGELDGLPDATAVAAGRIVQEALTNAVKHASGARIAVRVQRDAREVRVEVLDDGGTGGPRELPAGSGRGLAGMRERAVLFGGALDAGPRPDGGFRVFARLPLGEAAA